MSINVLFECMFPYLNSLKGELLSLSLRVLVADSIASSVLLVDVEGLKIKNQESKFKVQRSRHLHGDGDVHVLAGLEDPVGRVGRDARDRGGLHGERDVLVRLVLEIFRFFSRFSARNIKNLKKLTEICMWYVRFV